MDLGYELFTARALPKVYSDEVPIVLTYLCIKSINDLLAAMLVIKNGYHFVCAHEAPWSLKCLICTELISDLKWSMREGYEMDLLCLFNGDRSRYII